MRMIGGLCVKKVLLKIPYKFLFMVLLFVIALLCLGKAVGRLESGQQGESLKQLDQAIRKATLTCYATEGVYPPTIGYLEQNYGIQIDESRYTVFYEIFGDNIMPEITVMERQ